ncbi:MAG TPA: aldo/keto reductase, partial [Spirochaetota bacterium]|nr:aldo/keto reductase [Spirochaetota bacterium]
MTGKFTRKLGRSQIEVSALGMGCWAIGGPFYYGDKPDGWGNINDEESVKAIQTALSLGINFFDTADAYGVGHSEEVLGKALEGKRNEAVISTKFAHFGNSETKTLNGINITPSYIEKACDASLKRLKTDYIDVYLLHEWNIGIADVDTVCSVLERLVEKGKIRTYGWSTDLVDGAVLFARRKNCSVIEHCLNVFEDAPEMLK